MADNDKEKELNNVPLSVVVTIIGVIINLSVMVNWFTGLEKRLTKIETTIEIKLADSPYRWQHPNKLDAKSKFEKVKTL